VVDTCGAYNGCPWLTPTTPTTPTTPHTHGFNVALSLSTHIHTHVLPVSTHKKAWLPGLHGPHARRLSVPERQATAAKGNQVRIWVKHEDLPGIGTCFEDAGLLRVRADKFTATPGVLQCKVLEGHPRCKVVCDCRGVKVGVGPTQERVRGAGKLSDCGNVWQRL
jgi:hypothetical protein